MVYFYLWLWLLCLGLSWLLLFAPVVWAAFAGKTPKQGLLIVFACFFIASMTMTATKYFDNLHEAEKDRIEQLEREAEPDYCDRCDGPVCKPRR